MILLDDIVNSGSKRLGTRIFTEPKIKAGKFVVDIMPIMPSLILIIILNLVNVRIFSNFAINLLIAVVTFVVSMTVMFSLYTYLHNEILTAKYVVHNRNQIEIYESSLTKSRLVDKFLVTDLEVKVAGCNVYLSDLVSKLTIKCHSKSEQNNLLEYLAMAKSNKVPLVRKEKTT